MYNKFNWTPFGMVDVSVVIAEPHANSSAQTELFWPHPDDAERNGAVHDKSCKYTARLKGHKKLIKTPNYHARV